MDFSSGDFDSIKVDCVIFNAVWSDEDAHRSTFLLVFAIVNNSSYCSISLSLLARLRRVQI